MSVCPRGEGELLLFLIPSQRRVVGLYERDSPLCNVVNTGETTCGLLKLQEGGILAPCAWWLLQEALLRQLLPAIPKEVEKRFCPLRDTARQVREFIFFYLLAPWVFRNFWLPQAFILTFMVSSTRMSKRLNPARCSDKDQRWRRKALLADLAMMRSV